MQNGFVSKGGSYDKLGMDTSNYKAAVPKMRELINLCRDVGTPIFYRGYPRVQWNRPLDKGALDTAKIQGRKDKEGADLCAWHVGCTNDR